MTTAAVLSAVDADLVLRHDVDVEPPRAGEVAVRITAAGVCHSDLSMQNATMPTSLPVVLGHEAVGVVETLGPGVDHRAPGDTVVLSWVPQCGDCWFCRRGQPQLCQQADAVLLTGGLLDGTPRLRLDGQPLFQMLGIGAFCETVVVAADATVKVPSTLDPATAALLGCAVVTGMGAALNTAEIRAGDSVAVVGCGGVGLNVVQGARIAGAAQVIAVDVSAAKLELALELGATHVVDTSRSDPVSSVMGLTGERGADVAFEVAGRHDTMRQVVDMTRRGGQAVLVGIPSLDVVLDVPAMQAVILQERTIKGCWMGSSDIRRDIPRLVGLHEEGRLRLEPLIAARIGLDDVNRALTGLRTGSVGRSVVVY